MTANICKHDYIAFPVHLKVNAGTIIDCKELKHQKTYPKGIRANSLEHPLHALYMARVHLTNKNKRYVSSQVFTIFRNVVCYIFMKFCVSAPFQRGPEHEKLEYKLPLNLPHNYKKVNCYWAFN